MVLPGEAHLVEETIGSHYESVDGAPATREPGVEAFAPKRTPGSPCRGGVLARDRQGSIESPGTVRGCASGHAAAILDIGSPPEHAEIAKRLPMMSLTSR